MAKLTQDEKDAIRDAGVAQWWKDWYAADYSWEGLTKFEWQGWVVVEDKAVYETWIDTHGLPEGCPDRGCQVVPKGDDYLPEGTQTRPATLQDYWRDQENSLEVATNGIRYTIAHLPMIQKNGTGSWKTNLHDQKWNRLSKILEGRLTCAVKTDANLDLFEETINGQDGRACFQGCMLPALPSQNQSRKGEADSETNPDSHFDSKTGLHLSLKMAAIVHRQNFQGAVFGSAANFARTLFQSGNAIFTDAQFSGGNANFCGAQFSGGSANFIETQFSGGNASFIGANFSGGDANFIEAQFSGGEAIFKGANFSGGDANFIEAQFSGGEAIFKGANFSGGNANFEDAEFSGGYADFVGAEFSGGNADFETTKFSGGYADFRDAKFSGWDAYFLGAQFSGGEADFKDAQFSGGNAYFTGAKFSGGGAYFLGAQFSSGETDFRDAQFSGGEAYFRDAKFSGGDADFTNARFKRDINFRNSQIVKTISFTDAIFPPAGESYDAFRGTQFLGPALFNRTKFKDDDGDPLPTSDLHFPFNAFGLANFKDQLILTQRGDREAQIEFKRALASTAEACRGEDNDFTEDQYVALESGCTVLKRAMENVSDKNRAQRYFEFELRARQRRPSTPRLVKLFTKFYGWTADYGGSISRPLLTLGLLWLGFAFIYGVNALVAGVDLPTAQKFWGPADFSATQVFRPLFIWSKAGMGDTESWLYQYHAGLSAGGWLAIKALATAQSFLSLTLLFLFGLATKRKFQIS